MKKYLVSIGMGSLLVLSACGEDGNGSNEADTDETDEETEDVSAEEDDSDIDEEEEGNEDDESDEDGEDAATTEGGHEVGETVSDENGEQTLVSLADDVGTFETGPIILEIEKANGVSAVFEGEAAALLDQDEAEYIQVDMNVENTSEDDIMFYASQATLITDTGEQLDPDMFLSDHMDGEYFGEVSKSGSSYYFLENSTADEVQSIELRYSAPTDEDFMDVGDELQIEIDLER
ncbi:hypothetical protein HNR44_002976 [Geomicrobium halophilum]|uniref:DUF4352 domain-containing protein n=1 Tax=Geomicrobium halophilum TaxID=549000 RepID=A0A841PV18_9BACL|nr:hypothetical protein [Geomicrobium halophilum]MBB6450986.1 hypothetical protein [Geomicrobium halophilum]